jgi:hypothetical protein
MAEIGKSLREVLIIANVRSTHMHHTQNLDFEHSVPGSYCIYLVMNDIICPNPYVSSARIVREALVCQLMLYPTILSVEHYQTGNRPIRAHVCACGRTSMLDSCRKDFLVSDLGCCVDKEVMVHHFVLLVNTFQFDCRLCIALLTMITMKSEYVSQISCSFFTRWSRDRMHPICLL